jgi:hypothetical protein
MDEALLVLTMVGSYDRSYQNFVPGAASADQSP